MTPPMYKRVHDVFVEAKLTDGQNIQFLAWIDDATDTSLAKSYIVFIPAGGSPIDNAISGDYYVIVDVVSAKGVSEYQKADDVVNSIIDFVKHHPIHPCLGQITNLGGIPTPTLTPEGRLVYRLMFACLYGD